MEDDLHFLEMEDNLHFFKKWKITSIFQEILGKWKMTFNI